MSKLTKNKKLALSKLEAGRTYTLAEAVELVKEMTFTKFDASLDIDVRLGVNQQELGRLAGVSRQTISQIERGDYSPSVTLALTLARICGVTVEDIFSLEEENDEKQ